jgi:hypothetical protein
MLGGKGVRGFKGRLVRKGEQVLGQREVGENRQDRSGGARGGVPLDASPAGTIFLLSTFICAKGKSDPRMRFLKTDAGGARARLTSPPHFLSELRP